LFADIKELKLQEATKQNPYKLSYYVDLISDITQLIHTVKMRLQENNIISDVIWSIDEEKDIGLFDVMPASANKRRAIEYVMSKGKFSLNETLFAGDSGNDLSVMASEINSILVNNAMPDVKIEAVAQAESSGLEQALYLAKGNYLEMNGNYAAGILEGVAHYMPAMEKYFI
jgi:hydroxymethylpyrimidine pyrophosphatase-like HAD family hydrolase